MGKNILPFTFFILLISTLFIVENALGGEIDEIRAQMQRIQEENKILHERLDKQNEIIGDLSEKVEALEGKNEALSKEIVNVGQKPQPVTEREMEQLASFIDTPRLRLKGFSDVGFSAKITDNGNSSTFTIGNLDLFMTSELAERVNFLAEAVFHFNTDTNESHFDLERAELKYSLSDFFNIKAGRVHTPLGYWNQTFHHGSWFQTTIFRPEIYLFEDDGGILPIHSVGIEAFGAKPFDAFDLEYNLDLINGRGRTRTTVQNVKDSNNSKAVNALITIKPHFIEGLKFGTNIYHDIIPSNPDDANRTARINELILGGYFAYIHDKAEILGELFHIAHEDKTSGKDFNTLGYYLQAGYKINKLTPYYRFDFINFGNGDPYFSGVDTDIKKNTLGLRWDMLTWNALKLEYSHSDRKNSDNEDSFAVNCSFAF